MNSRWNALIESVLSNTAIQIESPQSALDCFCLTSRSEHLARDLSERGCRPHEPVIVHIANQAEDLAAFLGIWRAGATAVPVHRSAPAAINKRIEGIVGARFSIVDGVCLERSTTPPPVVPQAALIIFTSGSTGVPKGVVVSAERFAAKLDILRTMLALRPDEVVLNPLQLTFIFGIWVSFLALLDARKLILMPKFAVDAVERHLRQGVSVAAMVPSMLRLMDGEEKLIGPEFRLLVTGGESLGEALGRRTLKRFEGAQILDFYGTTETGSCDFCLPVHEGAGLGTIGYPTHGVSYRIADSDDGSRTGGELQIRTPFAMLGYLHDQARTAEAFDGPYFRTGDLARQAAGERVELTGRSKDIISRGAMKIAPLELDALFATHPDVTAALTGSVPDARLGEAIHVLLVPRSGALLDPQQVLQWAASRLEHYKLPNAVHVVEHLPLGSTGKSDRRAVASYVETKRAALRP
jgi:long-chain acyl-CoA synthetase